MAMPSETLVEVLRVLALALFDWSFAVACGWLLAAYWLRGTRAKGQRVSPQFAARFPSPRTTAWLMTISLLVQFYVLSVTFTGESRLAAVIRTAPSIAGTHGGLMIFAMACAAVVLLLVGSPSPGPSSLGSPSLAKRAPKAAVAAVCIVLIAAFHAATGHAAMDGNFSSAELLQFLHLSSMALWSGGVMVSGFAIIPRLAASSAGGHRTYLRGLSTVSTYTVVVVGLSGMYKSWLGLDRHLSGLSGTLWGRILLLKLCFVVAALALGWTHRRWTREGERPWTPTQTRKLVATLRVEAACLTAVLLLSAWLASVDPAGM